MSEWPRFRLGDIVSLEYGKALPARERDRNGAFLVVGSNGPDGSHSEPLAEGPGVVVGRKGSAGKVSWYEGDYWPIDTTYYVVPRMPVEMRWIYYTLGSLGLEDLATTTGVPGLNRNDAYRLEVPLPPRSEQSRIVKLLDQASHLRDLRTEADTIAERVLPAIFVKIFGHPASSKKLWRTIPLEGVASTASGGTPSTRRPDFYGGSVPWVQSGELTRRRISRTRKTLTEKGLRNSSAKWCQPGSILVAMYGATVGQVSILATRAATNQAICSITPGDDVLGPYLAEYLRLSKSTLLARRIGGAQPNISQQILRRLEIAVPPIERQRMFASLVEASDALGETRLRSQAELSELFQLLLAQSLSGGLKRHWQLTSKGEARHDTELRDAGPVNGLWES